MGVQSQQRVGSIKACKRRATKRGNGGKNRKKQVAQMSIYGDRPFIPHLHCYLCKKKSAKEAGRDVKIPKRGHHRLCPNKPCNKKKQVTLLTDFSIVNNNRDTLTAPTAVFLEREPPKQNSSSVGNVNVPTMVGTNMPNGSSDVNGRLDATPSGFFNCRNKPVDLATNIRQELV